MFDKWTQLGNETIKIEMRTCWIINVNRELRIERKNGSPPQNESPLSFINFVFCCQLSQTLISHVRTSPCLEMGKVLHWCCSNARPRVTHVYWAEGLSVWSPVSLFKTRTPWAFHGSGVCRGPGFSWQDPPQVPVAARVKRMLWAETQWQELMCSSTSVTAFISNVMWLIPWPGDISDTLF